MDLSKALNISVDYKDIRSPPNWEQRLFAEVILIDKTHDALHPMIYQLKDNATPSFEHILHWKNEPISLPSEAFILLGEAVAIDRKNKQILLTNKNTIAYNYLIIASGSNPVFTFENEKFMAAFQALVEALRIKDKIPSSFAIIKPPAKKGSIKSSFLSTHKPTSPQSECSIEKVAQPHICQAFHHKAFGPDLHSINKRLYEVHL